MNTTVWLAVVLVAAGTWASRASLILLLGRITLPVRVERSFRYVAPSVMAALSVPAFIAPDGTPAFSVAHLAAAVVGGLVAWRFSSFLGTLVAGLATFTLLRMLL